MTEYASLSPKPILLVFVIIYLLILIAFGALITRKNNTVKEFLVAGKGLGGFILVGTMLATNMGGGTVTGGANSIAYNNGIWVAMGSGIPTVIAICIIIIMIPKVRASGCITVPQLMEHSYGRGARIFAACITALSMFAICSYQFRGLGNVLTVTTGMGSFTASIIAAVVIIFLATSGGLKTVALTDAFSAFLCLAGLIITLPLLIKYVGGWDWVVEQTAIQRPYGLSLTADWGIADYLASYAPTFFMTLSDQNMYQRMISGKSTKDTVIGVVGWALAVIIVMPLVSIISYISSLYFGTNIAASESLLATTTLVPTVVGGLLLVAAAAFVITTGDSYLLSGASNVAVDIYSELRSEKPDDKTLLKMTRIFVLVFGILAFGLLQLFPSILAIQYWSYTVVGAGICPALVGAILFPKYVTKAGGIVSMAAGTIVTIVYEILGQPLGYGTVIIAVPVSILALIIVSAATLKRSRGQA